MMKKKRNIDPKIFIYFNFINTSIYSAEALSVTASARNRLDLSQSILKSIEISI